MRGYFDEQMARLNEEMIAMGAMVERKIDDACEALRTADTAKAQRVRDGDAEVDHAEREIEGLCLQLLLRQQPVARDLRQISAALKMITDMERIGDQSADIAEIVTMMDLRTPRPDTFAVMARVARAMVVGAVDAYVKQDVLLARQVIEADDQVDGCFDQIKQELTQRLAEPCPYTANALDLLMIAKYLERIADHATNIAEWVIWAVTGLYQGEELQ